MQSKGFEGLLDTVQISNGQAVVGEQRIKVKMIVNMHLRGQAPIEDVVEQYGLSPADIHAALAYYYDNREAFDQQYAEEQHLLKEYGQSANDHLNQLHSRQNKSSAS